jgi:anti-anti-sigma regulatory factor
MPVFAKQSSDPGEIRIEGDITLPCISGIRDTFSEVLRSSDRLCLDLKAVSRVDVSCLQLFCALHKSSLAQGKEIVFSAPLPSVMKETMQKAGYYGDSGCRRKTTGQCLLGGAAYE